jgi:hypothetical protein
MSNILKPSKKKQKKEKAYLSKKAKMKDFHKKGTQENRVIKHIRANGRI